MLEASIINKLIEQGFIVLGILIAGFMGYFFVKYLREERDRQGAMTEKMTRALLQSAVSNEKLSEVLDRNLQKMEDISTKEDLATTESNLSRLHKVTHAKLEDIKKEMSK